MLLKSVSRLDGKVPHIDLIHVCIRHMNLHTFSPRAQWASVAIDIIHSHKYSHCCPSSCIQYSCASKNFSVSCFMTPPIYVYIIMYIVNTRWEKNIATQLALSWPAAALPLQKLRRSEWARETPRRVMETEFTHAHPVTFRLLGRFEPGEGAARKCAFVSSNRYLPSISNRCDLASSSIGQRVPLSIRYYASYGIESRRYAPRFDAERNSASNRTEYFWLCIAALARSLYIRWVGGGACYVT